MTLIDEKKDTLAEKKATHALSVRNVLFATDFSAASEAALPYATAICRRFGSTLHVAHVLSDVNVLMMTGGVDYVSMGTIYEDAHTEAKEKIDQIASRLEGIPYHSYIRHGQVWKNLATLIDENEIELLVLGTHGRTGVGRLLLGSVAENILRHSPCPVLTVGPKVAGHAKLPEFGKEAELSPIELELRQIICATSFVPDAPLIARSAVRLAEEFMARLTLMHVIEDFTQLGSRPGPIEKGIEWLRSLVPKNATLQYAPEIVLEYGPVANTILKIAADREADLLVLGVRPSEDLVGATHLPWHTAHQVLVQAHCPVLTVRA
jgi:nucleotide-binding universal stress UspA family protein